MPTGGRYWKYEKMDGDVVYSASVNQEKAAKYASPTANSFHPIKEKEFDQQGDPFLRYRIFKQSCLIGAWICLGLTSEMSGPTLPDLKDRIGVNYEEISRSMLGKSIGVLIGSLCGSFLHEIIPAYSDLINTSSLVMISTAAFLLPWSISVSTAAIIFFLHGLGHGCIQIGGNALIMHLWQERAATAFHSLQFGFGVGALISPQLAKPFLSSGRYKVNKSMDLNVVPRLNPEDISRIEIPYSIAGTVVFLFAITLLLFYLKGPPDGFEMKKASTMGEITSLVACTGTSEKFFGIVVFICLFNYFIHGVGGEKAYGKFLFAYSYEEGILPKSQAYLLQSIFWCSFTIGRLMGIFLSRILAVTTILFGDICLILISTSVLAAFAEKTPIVLWVFTVILGMAIARSYPSGLSWANLHLTLNSMGILVFVAGGSVGDFLYPYLTGYLFEEIGPRALTYIMVGYAICFTLCSLALAIVVRFVPHKRPYDVTVEIEVT